MKHLDQFSHLMSPESNDHVINFKRFQPFKIRKILLINLYNMSYTCTIGVVCMILVTIKTCLPSLKTIEKLIQVWLLSPDKIVSDCFAITFFNYTCP